MLKVLITLCSCKQIKNKLPDCTEFLVSYLSLRILAFQKVKFYIFLLFRTHTLLQYRLWCTWVMYLWRWQWEVQELTEVHVSGVDLPVSIMCLKGQHHCSCRRHTTVNKDVILTLRGGRLSTWIRNYQCGVYNITLFKVDIFAFLIQAATVFSSSCLQSYYPRVSVA